VPFIPSVIPSAAKRSGPAQRTAASGLSPCPESLARGTGLEHRTLDAPLGLTLSGLPGSNLARDFARAPPARFAGPPPKAEYPPAPRSINQLLPDPLRPPEVDTDGATLLGFSHRCDPTTFKQSPVRAIGFTLCRAVHRCRLNRHAEDGHPRSTGVARIACGAELLATFAPKDKAAVSNNPGPKPIIF
jgi:hypothetical protein